MAIGCPPPGADDFVRLSLERSAQTKAPIGARDLRQAVFQVANPFGDGKDFALHQSPRFIIRIEEEKRSETACEIEYDVDAARAHAIDDFFEPERIAAALAGGGHRGMFRVERSVPGHGAGKDHF
jgi:hypothetical protein